MLFIVSEFQLANMSQFGTKEHGLHFQSLFPDRIDSKTSKKKRVPTPWKSVSYMKIGGVFQKPVAFTKVTGHGKRPPNVSVLFRGCGFEICEWLLADSITKK